MKIKCDRSILNEAIGYASRAVAQRSTLPVLEGLYIKSIGLDKIKITGYDLETAIECIIPATIEEEGDFVVNASTFCDIIRKMPSGELLIEKEDGKITMSIDVIEFDISVMSSEDYPDVVVERGEFAFAISQNLLKSIISETVYAVSANESKPVHTGCLFNINEDVLEVVGTDGFRLAKRLDVLSALANHRKFIVSGKNLSEFSRIINDSEELVHIYTGRTTVTFETKNLIFVARLIEGEFMDYLKAIPKTNVYKCKANTKTILDCLDRVSLLINDKQHSPVKLKLTKDKIEVNCRTPLGRLLESIAVESEGEDLEIGFNNKLLLDAFKNINSSEVTLDLMGNLSPLVIRPVEKENLLCLVLPVRIKGN